MPFVSSEIRPSKHHFLQAARLLVQRGTVSVEGGVRWSRYSAVLRKVFRIEQSMLPIFFLYLATMFSLF